MPRSMVVSDDSLNVYGFRVLTSGIDISSFLKNPVGLYNHTRSLNGKPVLPAIKWSAVSKQDGKLTSTPEFDENDEFSVMLKSKFENGFLNAASIGIQVVEWSDDPRLMVPGQTRATVTKCILKEISITDIPANSNAVTLYDEQGAEVDLSAEFSTNILPKLEKSSNDMEHNLSMIAGFLGLKADSDLVTVQSAITELTQKAAQVPALQQKIKDLEEMQVNAQKAQADQLLNDAVSAGRINTVQRASLEKLFDSDFEAGKNFLESMTAKVSLTQLAASGSTDGETTYEGKTFTQLRKESPEKLAELKATDPAKFKAMYKAAFGKEYKD